MEGTGKKKAKNMEDDLSQLRAPEQMWGCGVAGLRGCGVAGLRGCGVAGLRGCGRGGGGKGGGIQHGEVPRGDMRGGRVSCSGQLKVWTAPHGWSFQLPRFPAAIFFSRLISASGDSWGGGLARLAGVFLVLAQASVPGS